MHRPLAALSAVILTFALAGPAMAAGPGASWRHAPVYYVSIGDSLAAGQQPIGDPNDMHRTNQGYADQLYALAKATYPTLQLVKLGCPGESTITLRQGGICAYDHGTQLAEAVSFLHAHRQFIAFVTIDIGFNDFPCQTDFSCIPLGIQRINDNLPGILSKLRAAAGPDVPIVGMTIYDPFLAFWLAGDQALARASVWDGIVPINQLLTGIYGAAGMPVADVQGAFSTTDFDTIVTLPGVGNVPLNVARICQWTWVCAPPPYGPDNHANADGYHVMAEAFAAALP